MENMEISRHIGIGDIDSPVCPPVPLVSLGSYSSIVIV
jgi:hypothetical protein